MKEFETPAIEVLSLDTSDVLNLSYELPFLPFNIPNTFDIVEL